ncbi:MAG: hypothetical protein LUG61_02825 [Lachnospiraceae bacterium]|nr:hypothetical protein [Lachnospiraceae bacterium]
MNIWKKTVGLLSVICLVMGLLPITTVFAASMEVGTETELVAALGQAQDGDTITLSSDIEVNQQLVINADITLDLGGYTLTNNYVNVDGTGIYRFTLITTANVTIQNGAYEVTAPAETDGVETRGIVASEGNLTLSSLTAAAYGINVCSYSESGTLTILDSGISGSYAVGSFANDNTVIIDGSSLVGSVCGLYHNGSYYGFECYVSNTTIVGGDSDAGTSANDDADGVYISGSTTTEAAAGCHTAIFTDCTISGATGIEVKYTNLTLSNCTVTATGTTPTFEQYNNGSTTSGFAVVSTDNSMDGDDPKPSGTITINSGTYTGLIGLTELIDPDLYPDFKEATYVISGGNFTTQLSASYCAEGVTY